MIEIRRIYFTYHYFIALILFKQNHLNVSHAKQKASVRMLKMEFNLLNEAKWNKVTDEKRTDAQIFDFER